MWIYRLDFNVKAITSQNKPFSSGKLGGGHVCFLRRCGWRRSLFLWGFFLAGRGLSMEGLIVEGRGQAGSDSGGDNTICLQPDALG